MKISKEADYKSLDDYNLRQDSINRQESVEVKKCFTNQAHQTIIAGTAILSVVIGLMGNDINWYLLTIASLLVIALCLMTINVGAHKFNTSNRALAFQIHLSRITDYEEDNNNDERLLATELRRIDWEEAMFAWRIVQPTIYDYFYGKRKRKYGENDPEFVETEIKKYPWYDSKKLIDNHFKGASHKVKGKFYPGTYLRKMFYKLYFVIGLLLSIYIVSIWNIVGNLESVSAINIIILIAAAITVIYIVTTLINILFKCKKLESGLVSIQTSAFIWRIVCVTLLLAKRQTILDRNETNKEFNQIYNGYTTYLAEIACNKLYFNLHRIHDWMEENEKALNEGLKK